MTEDRIQITDMADVGVFCEICHRWNEGRSDVCSHCDAHLIGSRPLPARSVGSWLKSQSDEYTALGIPFTIKTQNVLRQWASLNSSDLGTLRRNKDAVTNRPDDSAPRRSDDSEPARTATTPNPDHVRQLMAEHNLTWQQAWKLSQRRFDDDDIVNVRRSGLRGWRIAVAVSGGLTVTMIVLLELMWRSAEGDVAAQNAFGAVAILFALPLFGLFVLLEISLITLGIKTKARLERTISWSCAALLIIGFGWTF